MSDLKKLPSEAERKAENTKSLWQFVALVACAALVFAVVTSETAQGWIFGSALAALGLFGHREG
jgi:hypothetical protein